MKLRQEISWIQKIPKPSPSHTLFLKILFSNKDINTSNDGLTTYPPRMLKLSWECNPCKRPTITTWPDLGSIILSFLSLLVEAITLPSRLQQAEKIVSWWHDKEVTGSACSTFQIITCDKDQQCCIVPLSVDLGKSQNRIFLRKIKCKTQSTQPFKFLRRLKEFWKGLIEALDVFTAMPTYFSPCCE